MVEVKKVQVGLTTRCNSNCYFCLREKMKRIGGERPREDLPKEAIQKIIDQGIRDIHLCCNRGEAIFHPDIDEIIDMIKSSGSRFEMNTNGDRFDTNWWYNLGQRMTEGDQVIFALDGLKNTHEFYRRTDWVNVFRNMKAFINGGGKAIWQMIVFKHNEHQVNLVKKLSKTIGCSETWVINSREYNKKYQKPIKEFSQTKEDILLEEGAATEIQCQFFEGERVYIGVDGSVWPCCFTRCHFGFDELAWPRNRVTRFYKEEKDFNNVLKTPLNEIVNNSKMFDRVFKNMHIDTYVDGKLITDPRMKVNFCCQMYCSSTPKLKENRRYIKHDTGSSLL